LQSALIGALNSRVVEELQTTARLASARDRGAANAWVDFDTVHGRVAVAPLLVDGALARMTSGGHHPDGAAAAATLGRIEPLLAALETSLGVELQPTGLSERVDVDAMLLLRLDGCTSHGDVRHRIVVAVEPDMAISPLPLPLRTRLPAIVAGLRHGWTARIAGPAISTERARGLATGDLILLGMGQLVAKLSLPARNEVLAARVDWLNHVLVIDEGAVAGGSFLNSMDGPERDGEDGATPDWQSLRLPTVIELEGTTLTAADLATIGKGSVLPLPAQGGTLTVKVRAGDTIVADGELVAIGEGFGVLVTGVRTSREG
jgi:flagellar motor switch/type III secretory pathway protein FliN